MEIRYASAAMTPVLYADRGSGMLLLPMPRLSNVQHLRSSDSFSQDLCRIDCNISPIVAPLLLLLVPLLPVLRFSKHLCMV